jgi:hypothetical protein
VVSAADPLRSLISHQDENTSKKDTFLELDNNTEMVKVMPKIIKSELYRLSDGHFTTKFSANFFG